jgi:outer membrane protein TolC
LAQARLNVGLGLPSDVVSAQTNLAQSVIGLEEARTNASTARIALALSIGVDARTPIQVGDGDEASIASNDVNALVATAETQRPDILAAVANVQSNQFNVKAAKTNNAPIVSGTIGVATHANGFPGSNDQAGVGVQLSWDPFDGGLTKGIVKEARGNLTIAQNQLTSVQLSVVSDVAQAYVNLRNAEQRLPTANSEVANAQEDVRIAEGRYREGIGTFVDVTTAQALLVTAQTDRAAAIAAIDTARAALAHAIGAPLPAAP